MDPRPAQLFYADDALFDGHHAPAGHPERPARLQAIREGLVASLRDAGAHRIEPCEASPAQLSLTHDEGYLARLEQALSQGAGLLDADTFFSEGTRSAARHAAGTAAAFACRLMEGHSRAGFLALRPPGHHATRARAMGFCLLNNIAVAAHAALARGASKVAIVDWDVHHGNGTQDIFAEDARVLFVSLHQAPLYPGTGASSEIGGPRALGRTVNLPLPAGSDAPVYRAALDRVARPVLMQFAPELILVSAGFDAHRDDPLSDMALGDADYGALTRMVWQWACDLGHGRLGLLLEGGYDLRALRDAGQAVAQALLGKHEALPAGRVPLVAERAIDATRRALSPHWEL